MARSHMVGLQRKWGKKILVYTSENTPEKEQPRTEIWLDVRERDMHTTLSQIVWF